MTKKMIQSIRENNPLIHNITNIVVANDSANGLLAIGASPFMSDTLEEMSDIAEIASATVLNMGTLNDYQLATMKQIGISCNQLNKPVILDPVGAGATQYRKKAVYDLLDAVNFTAIKGNAGEIAALAGIEWSSCGVDAGVGDADISDAAKTVAKKYNCLVGVSGEVDIITDGYRIVKIFNGTDYFPKMTGSGCLLSCICGTFLAVANEDEYFEALQLAFESYAIAGEIAASQLSSCLVGSFRMKLLDELSQITDEKVKEMGKIEYVN